MEVPIKVGISKSWHYRVVSMFSIAYSIPFASIERGISLNYSPTREGLRKFLEKLVMGKYLEKTKAGGEIIYSRTHKLISLEAQFLKEFLGEAHYNEKLPQLQQHKSKKQLHEHRWGACKAGLQELQVHQSGE